MTRQWSYLNNKEHRQQGAYLVKVWGVSNFYSHLERVSDEGSKFSLGYFTLVVTSAFLAIGGLLANSVVVIISSMCTYSSQLESAKGTMEVQLPH